MLSSTHGVGSPPLTHREVVNLVDSDEDIWPAAPLRLNHFANLLPLRNQPGNPTLGEIDVDTWDPFPDTLPSPVLPDLLRRRNPVSTAMSSREPSAEQLRPLIRHETNTRSAIRESMSSRMSSDLGSETSREVQILLPVRHD